MIDETLPSGKWFVLGESLEKRIETLLVKLDEGREQVSEEGIHRLRVACRRIISSLDLLRELEVLKAEKIKSLRTSVKSLLKSLGPMRDLHIQLLFMKSLLEDFPEIIPAYERLAVLEAEAAAKTREYLQGLKAKGLSKDFQKALASVRKNLTKKNFQDDMVPGQISMILHKARGKVIRRRASVTREDLASVEEMRNAFKKFRYMVEAVEDVMGITDDQIYNMKLFQTLLGEIQDTRVKIRALDKYLDDVPASVTTEIKGRLSGLQGELLDELFMLINKEPEEWIFEIDMVTPS